jgi:hypothetical protein
MAKALAGEAMAPLCQVGLLLDFQSCVTHLTGSVFDLARRKAPEHYRRLAGHWWWGASGSGLDLDRALGPQIQTPRDEESDSVTGGVVLGNYGLGPCSLWNRQDAHGQGAGRRGQGAALPGAC